ncbi:sugar ABC transporter ATP-binding protein [Alicyclobacillus cellulosilyticus]|uniref:Sugar ABC transporter ATP-binding protein n=1 Tax=Alicyclobacillus cellulosilyticus TaxID=1003997 RepID=A0A917NMW8_9BACL|nr:ABC transporter ATP-binding protein [Alicyclobacillus cellulosilyticus]GGJ12886.1 sugar ABC transporter ATP-binding protein [Alicyclobacillus cellulosilyticus]
MSSVRLQGVTKHYGTQQVLADVRLDVQDGEFMVLVGPSGSGKSTILRCIAGLEDVTQGDIFIGSTRVNDLPPHKRDVAMVFQSYALYPNLSVFENIAFPLRAARVPKQDVARRVREVAARLGLEPLLARKPRALSGGQRQRVAIARAIIRNPQVFLMDEPLSNLDAKLRGQMRAEILRLQRQLGVTTVFVTHDQVEAMTMGDRITVMDDGRIQQVGTPHEVYHRPANTFVAGFLGAPAMNLIPGRMEADGRSARLAVSGGGFSVPHPVPDDLAGRPLIVGIRPEDIRIATENGDGVDGTVDLVEYLGSETVITLSAAGEEWRVKWSGHPRVSPGDRFRFTAAHARIYLFDAASTALLGTLAEWAGETADQEPSRDGDFQQAVPFGNSVWDKRASIRIHG